MPTRAACAGAALNPRVPANIAAPNMDFFTNVIIPPAQPVSIQDRSGSPPPLRLASCRLTGEPFHVLCKHWRLRRLRPPLENKTPQLMAGVGVKMWLPKAPEPSRLRPHETISWCRIRPTGEQAMAQAHAVRIRPQSAVPGGRGIERVNHPRRGPAGDFVTMAAAAEKGISKRRADRLFCRLAAASPLPMGKLRAQLIPDSTWKRAGKTLG